MSKKTYLFIAGLLAVIMLSFGNRVQAQYHILTHYFNDSCGGNVMLGFSANADSLTNAEISYGDGTKDTAMGYPYASTFYYSSIHHYTSAGTYTIKLVLYNTALGRVDSLSFTDSVYGCSFLWGRAYDDVNSNCIYDAGDHMIYAPISIKVDSASIPVDTISCYGYFYYRAYSTSVTYDFSVISSPGSLTATCPSGGTLSIVPSSFTMSHVGDFGFTCGSSSSFDVAISSNVIHTGRHAFYAGFTLTNSSCTSKSGTFTVNVDPNYTPYWTYPSGGTISGHTVSWSYSNLSVDSSQQFGVWGSHAGTYLTPGTSITTSAYVDRLTGDASAADDSLTSVDTVTSSWDPNAKTVMPQGNIKSGDMLTYTLAFENTGNAPAMNIHIIDTLSSYVDPNSIQVIASTHPVKLLKYIDAVSGNTVLRFDFANINLPDTSHHGQADGWVTFSINSKTGLFTGTNINNRAGIYFDDNEVVMTNTVTNTIRPLGVINVNNISQVSVYPNPVTNDLTIQINKGSYDHVSIVNTIGQVVITQQQLHTGANHVNVKALTPGIYYMILRGDSGTKVEKIEKL